MSASGWSRSCALFLAAALVTGFAAGVQADSEPPPPGSDWEGYNKSLEGQRYSLLDQIKVDNVARLAEVCRVPLAARGSLQSGLVVIGDTMYAATPTDTFAIDPTTCKIKWQHSYHRAQAPGLSVNRGVAYLSGRVFRGTDDGRLLALDAASGRELWSNVVGDPTLGEYVAAAPVAWNGLVIVGISGGEFGIRGRILAYEAQTGREVWRFNTIPMGKEAGAETWGDSKWAAHGGGATWSTITIDPVTAELFAPIGNPVPDFAPMDRPGANLFTNSVLVLDARTGELRWWYQLQTNDDHDHDLAAAPVLFRNGKNENMLAAAGKDGLLHVVDRVSHKVRFKVPVTTVDVDRKKVTTEGVRVCPGAAGGVLWNGPAFDPTRMTLFVGSNDMCMLVKATPGTAYAGKGLYLGGSGGPTRDPASGWVTAVDANTGAVRWKYHAETPVLGAVTPTAGGIVMTGDNAGNFLVFESETGKLLRKEPTGGALAGGVVTYMQAGKQYVAFTSGNVSPASFGSVGRPSVVIWSLPGSASSPTTAAPADAARGKQLYSQLCAGCHGPDGDRVAGKDLKSVRSRMNASQLASFIVSPTGAMPRIFPDPRTIDDERDLRDVAAYVSDLSAQGLFPGDAAVSAAQAERGQAAYTLNCQSCHSPTLEGTQFGPALKGGTFAEHWRGRARAAFSEQIRTTMPPGKLGSVSSDAYADIEAFILQANAGGAAAGAAASEAAGNRAATASAPAPSPAPSASGGEGAAMMAPMQRRDDPLHEAVMKARKEKLTAIAPVTDAMLQKPDPADWLMWRRTYDSLGYSPLRQIDRSSVKRLRTAWSWVLPPSANEITPLVHDGVMFVYSGAAIQALDAVTGDLLWQYTRSLSGGIGFASSHGKALAIYEDKLFSSTADGHMIALDFRTGKVVWDQEILASGSRAGLSLNSGPIVAKGTVIFGVSLGVSNPGGCFIIGLDAATGKERWRFNTIARPGQPGGDTWNGAPVEERYGGGVWTAGSYDPELNLVYFGIGNTYDTATLLEPRPGTTSVSANDALYTDSTVALRPDTGELVWHFQHQKRDVWDLDWVFEQSLVTMPVKGQSRKLVVTGSKTALFDALDAATGAYVFSTDLGVQNLVTAVDPLTGEKKMNPAVEPEAGKTKLMCPNSVGARNWPATAINPDNHVLYVPILENCADYTYAPRSAAQTAAGGIDMRFSARTPPDHDGNYGRLAAVDLKKQQILWTYRQRIPPASAALATAGGLVFAGDVDRYFTAHDERTGKVLWRTRLDAAAESFPITYSVKGKQYLAVVAGSGSPWGAAGRGFVPDVVAPAAGVIVVVFELR